MVILVFPEKELIFAFSLLELGWAHAFSYAWPRLQQKQIINKWYVVNILILYAVLNNSANALQSSGSFLKTLFYSFPFSVDS